MSKFNTTSVRSATGRGFVESTGEATTNHNGGEAFVRSDKSELFLAAVSDFGGEQTFYESAGSRSDRIIALAHKVAVADPDWYAKFVSWLRREANLRSISLMLGMEGAKALIKAGIPGGRALVSSVILRADEPGEALGYWMSTYGRKVPSAVKRGVADAVVRSYSEFSLGKYDTASKGFRFGDVIRLVHPTPATPLQADLFKFAIERRMDSSAKAPESLVMADKRKQLLGLPKAELRKLVLSEEGTSKLKEAGLTWENVAGEIGLDAKTWEALIPTMGYMALLRNLRNFEEAGVSDKVLDKVADRIANPEQVAKSRQLPFRFLSAYLATSGTSSAHIDRYAGYYESRNIRSSESLRFSYPLEKALNASLKNVPSLKGNTLILVDRSGSMWGSPSKNTQMNFADSAAIFGTALALRAEQATLVQFGDSSEKIEFSKNSSVLSVFNKFKGMGGTRTADAIKKHLRPEHTRVVIVTDEQYAYSGYYGNPADVVPKSVPLYTWNLVGYKAGGVSGHNRITFGGLTDQSFGMIELLEAGRDAAWPWETKSE